MFEVTGCRHQEAPEFCAAYFISVSSIFPYACKSSVRFWTHPLHCLSFIKIVLWVFSFLLTYCLCFASSKWLGITLFLLMKWFFFIDLLWKWYFNIWNEVWLIGNSYRSNLSFKKIKKQYGSIVWHSILNEAFSTLQHLFQTIWKSVFVLWYLRDECDYFLLMFTLKVSAWY